MISRTQLQITVGAAAAIYITGFFLLNQPADMVVLRLYGLVVAVVSFLFVLFDRFIWKVLRKVPSVNAVFKHPVLHGTWKGTFESSYVYSGTGEREGPAEAYLIVRQTYSSIHLEFFTRRSPSESIACELKRKTNGRYKIYTIYENEPPPLSRGTSPIHHGGMIFSVVGDPASALVGSYWTDRETYGELNFDKHSKEVHDRFEDASKGTYT